MKIASCIVVGTGEVISGPVINGGVIPFSRLTKKSTGFDFTSVEEYLAGLPESFVTLSDRLEEGHLPEGFFLEDCKLLSPVPKPPLLLDFGLTPRHLKNSARNLLRNHLGPVIGSLAFSVLGNMISNRARGKPLQYYKGNASAVIGSGDTVAWPAYSSYLDIEPELALVFGNSRQPLGGYTIFNDSSARDVQLPEMLGTGPARSKDFAYSKGLGPFLITPDEISDPLDISVSVEINRESRWEGETSEYCFHPEEVLESLVSVFMPDPGTVIGMGTIPDCTGLDRNEWLLPGDKIEIQFSGLGNLVQYFGKAPETGVKTSWPDRAF
jgi:2-keto-4-pentenoate hydratase/2-oxohepta-3-ene-1,7-dioic acid hydratase in catechol pathway